MYRATKDIILPTTITGSLPRPSWYTENLGSRHFLEAMVTRRFREQYEDALTCYLRDQELAGLDIVTDGDCRFDDDVGGQSWTAYPPNHMTGLDVEQSGADAGGPRRRLVSARPHPARLSGIARDAGDHRPDRPRQSAIHRDVEGGAALHREAGEIRRGVGGDRRLRAAGPTLQEHPGAHVRHRRRLQRGIPRARRRRLPGDPDRGAADPHDRGAQGAGQGDHAEIHRRGVQPHGQGPARQDRGLGAFVLGQSVAAEDVRRGHQLQAVARGLQHGGRRRHHLRSRRAPAASISKPSARPSSTRKSASASSTTTRCRSKAPSRSRRRSAPRSSTFRPSG